MHRGLKYRPGFRGLWQSGTILLAAAAAALGLNCMRPQGLSLIGDWSTKAQNVAPDDTGLSISLDEAKDLFFAGGAVFIDARSPKLFQFGHILGARNLPWQEMDAYVDSVTADLDPDTLVITYCDGDGCGLSRELALELITRGYRKVRVLVNGWSLWQAAGLPVATGAGAPVS